VKAYPLKFKPIYKELIWGGRKLREFFGKDIPTGRKIGESWELVDLPNDKSIIANGELAGLSLTQIIRQFPRLIMGDENFRGPFPIMIKFIDAQDVLSIQVHPDAQACQRIGSGVPKTEFWYILAAEKDAVIYKGLKKGITKAEFLQAIQSSTVAELLNEIPVKEGQCYFLPGGTIHSIGAGILIAEIQTPSDTTYRIFDWGRLDAGGRPRQLHTAEAVASINFDNTDINLPATECGHTINCKYFKVRKERNTKDSRTPVQAGLMQTLLILKGSGVFESDEKTSVEFLPGDTLLVPAGYQGKMQCFAETEYLKVTI
jgi:mannose-6-phosphate isomerase